MELHKIISNINKDKKIKIGLIVANENNEVLLIREDLKRINKTIYNIPTIEVYNLEEKNIINTFNKKHNLKIDKIFGYVNKISILDDNCDKVEQINLYTENNENTYNFNQYVLKHLSIIEEEEFVPENVKSTLEIFKYNKKVTKSSM